MADIILNFDGNGGDYTIATYNNSAPCANKITPSITTTDNWENVTISADGGNIVIHVPKNPSTTKGRKTEAQVYFSTSDGDACGPHTFLLCQQNSEGETTAYTYGTVSVSETAGCGGGSVRLTTHNMPYTATTSGGGRTASTTSATISVTVAKCTAATGCTTNGSGTANPGGTIEYTITQSGCGSLCGCDKLTVRNIGTIPYSGGTYTAATYDNCISNVVLNTSSAPTGMITTSTTSNGNVIVTFGSNSVANSRSCTCPLTYSFDMGNCSESLSFTQEAAPSPKATLTLSNGTTVTVPCNGDSELKRNEMTSLVTASDVVSVHVEDCVTKIGDYAFKPDEFNNLTSITMADSVTEIGVQVHSDPYCGQHGPTKLKSITFSKNLISIGDSAFWGCARLTTLDLPSGLKTIGNDAFRSCSGLTKVALPDSVTTLGGLSFHGCAGITEFTFGTGFTGVTSPGQCLQYTNLTKVTCKAVNPPVIDDFMFCASLSDECVERFRVYVPRNSVSAYEQANGWSRYYIDDEGF